MGDVGLNLCNMVVLSHISFQTADFYGDKSGGEHQQSSRHQLSSKIGLSKQTNRT